MSVNARCEKFKCGNYDLTLNSKNELNSHIQNYHDKSETASMREKKELISKDKQHNCAFGTKRRI